MDTSLDTSKRNPIFPDILRGRKYVIHKDFVVRLNKFHILLNPDPENSHILFEKYLETEDPNYLFEAVKANLEVLQGKPQAGAANRLGGERLLPQYVDAYTIVWETIRWWRERLGDGDKRVKRYLSRLGNVFTILPEGRRKYTITRDGIVHVTPIKKGTKAHLEFGSPDKFIKDWDRVEEAFRTKKKRYRTITKPLLSEMHQEACISEAFKMKWLIENKPKRNDIRNIIENNLDERISEKEFKRFNLSRIGTITASYIAWQHKKLCPICKKDKLGYKTFLTLYKKARKDLAKQELNKPC